MPFPTISPAALIAACLIGGLSAYLSYRRGRNPYLWFFIGFLFGIFGIMAIFFAPLTKKKKGVASLQPTEIKPIPKIAGPKDKFWYYLDPSNQQQGPMSHDALTLAWKEGRIVPTSYVWNEELTDWKPLQELIKN